MTTEREKEPDSRVVTRLAGRGEEAVTRLMEELGRNTMVTEALARAMSARRGLDAVSRTALAQVGLAAAEDVRELRQQVADLEKRLGKLEQGGEAGAGEGRTAPTATASRRGAQAATKTKSTATAPGGGTSSGGTASPSRASRSTPSG